jgi:hypothetical protein
MRTLHAASVLLDAGCQHALSQAVLFTAQCLAMHFASEASKYASMRFLHAQYAS